MSMQIIIDPSKMTVADRERLAQVLDLFAVARPTVAASAPAVPIAPNDNPETGLEQPSANAAFRTEPSPAAAFSQDNPAAVFGTDPNLNPPAVAANTSTVGGQASESIPGAQAAAATPAGTPANAATVDLDKNGLPWDAAIHAETKSKNKDGSWRYKRGVAPELITQREAELRALMAIPSPSGNAAAATGAGSQDAQGQAAQTAAMTAPVAHEVAPAGNAPAAPPPPPAQPSQSVAPPPPAPSQDAPHSVPAAATPTNAVSVNPSGGVFAGVNGFVDFIGKLGPLLQSQRLTQDEVKAACRGAGVPALEMLAPRADLVPTVAAMLDAILLTKPAV